MVRSHKTPRVPRCPVFPELLPYLLLAREMAPDDAVYVQTRYCHADSILTTLDEIITRVGFVAREKPMPNRRATRETELLAHYPAKDVTSWLGNSHDLATKHDAMTLQASFDRAVTDGAFIEVVTRNVESGVAKSLPPKLPGKLQENPPLGEDTKKSRSRKPIK
ncbi:MAG: hypothetical protein AAGJ40_02670 [Planctomycetota bacterium]